MRTAFDEIVRVCLGLPFPQLRDPSPLKEQGKLRDSIVRVLRGTPGLRISLIYEVLPEYTRPSIMTACSALKRAGTLRVEGELNDYRYFVVAEDE